MGPVSIRGCFCGGCPDGCDCFTFYAKASQFTRLGLAPPADYDLCLYNPTGGRKGNHATIYAP